MTERPMRAKAGATERWISQRESAWGDLDDDALVAVAAGELKALLRQARDRMALMERSSDPPAEALIRCHAEARRDRLDALARLIFADRAILLDDPLGANIPKNLWERYLPQAVAIMLIMRRPEE